MRKLIAQQWVTVDNIAAEEDGGLSFVSGESFTETTNTAFKASVMGFINSVDTMILGANTYAQSKGYWPHAADQGEYGEKLNSLTKFVASSKLKDAPWGDYAPATVTRGRHHPGTQGPEWQGPLAVGESAADALAAGRRRHRRGADAGLPGVTRRGDPHL